MNNGADGLELDEHGAGNLSLRMQSDLVEEEGNGDLSATISDVATQGNGNADIEAVQEDAGKGKATIGHVTIDNDIKMDGVTATKF